MLLTLTLTLSLVDGVALATDSDSTTLAQQLAYFCERTGLNAVAASDPSDSGAFVAALYVTGNLLVVRARYPAVDEMSVRLKTGKHFQVYLDLIATPTPVGKLFVMDAGANGLLSGVPGAEKIDVIRERAGQITFNGDFAGQGMAAAQYDAKLAQANTEYARLLELLLSSVQ